MTSTLYCSVSYWENTLVLQAIKLLLCVPTVTPKITSVTRTAEQSCIDMNSNTLGLTQTGTVVIGKEIFGEVTSDR